LDANKTGEWYKENVGNVNSKQYYNEKVWNDTHMPIEDPDSNRKYNTDLS
jgi:hypothetical protein